jgi:flagellar motor switch protein FliN/FliY
LAGVPLNDLGASAPQQVDARLDTLLDMMLPVTVEFGRTTMAIQNVLELGTGSVIPLDRRVGEPVDIYVSERRLAEGEVVVIGDTFGIRITRVLPAPREHPRAAGR